MFHSRRIAFVLFLSILTVSAGILGAARAAEIKMLEFVKPGCPQCVASQPTVDALLEKGYNIEKIDVSRIAGRRYITKYGLTVAPTFIILLDDQEIGRHKGYASKNDLLSLFERATERAAAESQDAPREEKTTENVTKEGETRQAIFSRNRGYEVPAEMPKHPLAGLPAVAGMDVRPVSASASEVGFGADLPTKSDEPTKAAPAKEEEPAKEETEKKDPVIAQLEGACVLLAIKKLGEKKPIGGGGIVVDSRGGHALVLVSSEIFKDFNEEEDSISVYYQVDGVGRGATLGKLLRSRVGSEVTFVQFVPNEPVAYAPLAKPKADAFESGGKLLVVGIDHKASVTISPKTVLAAWQEGKGVQVESEKQKLAYCAGIFDTQGNLLGVTKNLLPQGKESFYHTLSVVKSEIASSQLTGIFEIAKKDNVPEPTTDVAKTQPTTPEQSVQEKLLTTASLLGTEETPQPKDPEETPAAETKVAAVTPPSAAATEPTAAPIIPAVPALPALATSAPKSPAPPAPAPATPKPEDNLTEAQKEQFAKLRKSLEAGEEIHCVIRQKDGTSRLVIIR